MLILRDRRFISAPFDSEQEIETAVAANAEYLFGPHSIYLSRTLLRGTEGFGTVPDGYVVDLLAQRWFIIEAELGASNVWSQIVPKVTRQLLAANQPAVRRLLLESIIDLYRTDALICARFEEANVVGVDVRRIVSEIIDHRPIIGISIDAFGQDLREWAHTLNTDVRLWLVRKLVDFQDPSIVAYELPDEYLPTFDSVYSIPPIFGYNNAAPQRRTIYDVSMTDLLNSGLAKPDQKLTMIYRSKEGSQTNFEAILLSDGSLLIQKRRISSISDAAVYCINQAGGSQRTADGWMYWKNESGYTLNDLRLQFLSIASKKMRTKES